MADPDANFPQAESSSAGTRDSSSLPRLRDELEAVKCAIVQQNLEHQKRMDALEKKQHELEAELARIVYPILTLPPEIVSRLFVACLQDDPPACRGIMPRLLTQVCRQWRQIAICSSELWNCVRLGISAGSRKASRELDVLDTWFARAEKRPLLVTLFGHSKTTIPQPMISRLVAVGEQLQSLSVPISLEDFRGLARDGIQFPNLLRLELEIIRDWRVIETPFERALRMPRLQSLTLHKIDIAPFTLPSLRRLELDLDPRTIGSIVSLPAFIARSRCVLEHLSLPLPRYAPAEDFVACLRAVPSLTSLGVRPVSLGQFYEAMIAGPRLLPHLRDLTIHNSDPIYSNYPALIELLHHRLSPPARLRSVTLKLESLDEYVRAKGHDKWFPQSAKAAFEPLVAQGLRVEVYCNGDYYWPDKGIA
ncbi:hypothetical protein DFH06DRAFT_172810 [Mycena polygramma]|nr:hypothetical protein DFH06DRAFT_172810 [Mycena polygramma]